MSDDGRSGGDPGGADGDGDNRGDGSRDADRRGEDGPVAALWADRRSVAVGVLAGLAAPVVQFTLWQLVAGGPLAGPGAGSLRAEMALFLALGVVVPAGAVLALVEFEGRTAGVAGAVAVAVGAVAVVELLGAPGWIYQGLAGAALVGGLAVALDRRSVARRGRPDRE